MNKAISGIRRIAFFLLAIFIVMTLGRRGMGPLCAAGGLSNFVFMALLASLALSVALSDAGKGFRAGGLLLAAGLVANILRFFGVI